MTRNHIKLGSVCPRLKDAKIFAREWVRPIEDPLWSMATEALLIALMRKLQSEKGKSWDMPDLLLVAQSSHVELSQIVRTYQPKSAWLLGALDKAADALISKLHIVLSGVGQSPLATPGESQ